MEGGAKVEGAVDANESFEAERELETAERELEAIAQKVENALGSALEAAGPAAPHVEALVAALIELYGRGIERLYRLAEELVADRARLVEAVANDRFVGGVLVLHGVHPLSLAERIGRAIERVRRLNPGSPGLKLSHVAGGVAHLRASGEALVASGALMNAIGSSVRADAPEIQEVRVSGVARPPQLVSVDRLTARRMQP